MIIRGPEDPPAAVEAIRNPVMIESQFARSIFWSRLAALPALPGAPQAFWQLAFTLDHSGWFAGEVMESGLGYDDPAEQR